MSLEPLFEQLKHPNPNIRNDAMLDIADQRDESTIPKLMSILDETDVTYRRAAVKTLGVIGAEAVPPIVHDLLHSDNATVRSSCAKALAQISVNYPDIEFPIEGLQGLKLAIEDVNPVVHIASIMALGTMGMPAFDILRDSLQTTENPAAAVAIVNALADLQDERSAQVLKHMSEDDTADPYVKESAASALSRLEMIMNFKKDY
ncbi:MAG: HEAT repeat domain-containing protein [Acaryochloridaceae cyanobacterium RL_2_7]|nr:HEAT repeat domain-containing protein [Acaryochloridaceae cyanobacterium RL_2_7]